MPELGINQRGIALMVAAMALYVLNDSFVKLTTRHFSASQILAVRGLFATIVVAALAWRADELRQWRRLVRPIVGIRSVLEITTAATSVAALALAPLATVTAIMMGAPLIIAMGAFALGWERAHGGRIVAVLLGFAGVVLVVKPSARLDGLDSGAAFALLCALSLAARDLVTRRIPAQIPSVLVALVTTVAVCGAGAVLAAHETWPPLDRVETVILAAAALCAALGNYALIAACRGTDLSVVSPFRYTIVLWSVLLGYLGWGETPDAVSILGMALISGAGLYAVFSSRRV